MKLKTGGCEVSGILVNAEGRGFEVYLVGLSYARELSNSFSLLHDIENPEITRCWRSEQNRKCVMDLIATIWHWTCRGAVEVLSFYSSQ